MNKLSILFCVIPFFSKTQSRDTTMISGDWTCISIAYDMTLSNPDEPYPNNIKYIDPIGNLQIKNSMIFLYDYPCEFYYCHTLKPDSTGFKFSHIINRGYIELNTIRLSGDTLIRNYDDATYCYIRDKFDPVIIHKLAKDSINPSCLKNTWHLQKGFDSGYDGLGYVTFTFPYKLPENLTINSTNLASYAINKRWIEIPVNGVKRKFRIAELSLKTGRIELREGKWYKPAKGKEYNYRIWYELKKE